MITQCVTHSHFFCFSLFTSLKWPKQLRLLFLKDDESERLFAILFESKKNHEKIFSCDSKWCKTYVAMEEMNWRMSTDYQCFRFGYLQINGAVAMTGLD